MIPTSSEILISLNFGQYKLTWKDITHFYALDVVCISVVIYKGNKFWYFYYTLSANIFRSTMSHAG